ncbi:hypothetical protein LEP1GSC192_1071 [Leptospira sp. B5-022]|nr:hypothetical protein LEP1GSC192_1071 [Leptospira sp. B5-022]
MRARSEQSKDAAKTKKYGLLLEFQHSERGFFALTKIRRSQIDVITHV